jgi:hypothetical protein
VAVRQAPGGLKQPHDLLVAVEVRVWAMVSVGKQVLRRHGGARIARTAVQREATHHPQAIRPLGRLRSGGLRRPGQCEFVGDVRSALTIGEVDKTLQQAAGQAQLVAEGAMYREILIECGLQLAHVAPLGHGSAMPRRAAMSTLA